MTEFGSPTLITHGEPDQIVQIGIAPDRIDLLLSIPQLDFETAWKTRIEGRYGNVAANWIDIDALLKIKESLDDPRHQDDARNLKRVLAMRRAEEP